MNELNYTCNLSAGLRMTPLKVALVQGEANAHTLKIAFDKDGAPYSMDSGATIVGSFIRLDSVASTDENPTILLQGAVSDGVASVTLSAACYAVVGRFRLMVTATVGEDTTAILWLEGRVAAGATGTVYDPENVMPDVTGLLAKINECKAATAAANAAAESATSAAQQFLGKYITDEEKLLLLELLQMGAYRSNTAAQNYSKLYAAWKDDVSALEEQRPRIVSVEADKTEITVGESVTFTVTQKNAASIRFLVDGVVNERIYEVQQETITFAKQFQSAGSGTRIVAFQAVDANRNIGLESDGIIIIIKETAQNGVASNPQE